MSEAALIYKSEDFYNAIHDDKIKGGVVVGIYESNYGDTKIRKFGNFRNSDARLDENNIIRNSHYVPMVEAIRRKFNEFNWIIPDRILFVQNIKEKPKDKRKRPIYAKTSKAPKWFPDLLGIDYIITFYELNMEHMSSEQVIVLLYEQLRLITDGDYGVKGFENILQTVGKDWAETKAQIIDILGNDFTGWSLMRRAGNQVSLFDGNVTYLNR